MMAKEFAILVLLANLLVLNCQEEELGRAIDDHNENTSGKPSYSFSYGVSDAQTGDIKAVWETKEGDTVKGHYSVLEPDGTMRSVEYSAGPKTGFTAVVNNENSLPQVQNIERSMAEPKAMRDFDKFYDISEDMDDEEFYSRKRNKRPFESYKERDYPQRKRPKYPFDLEPSEYTHSITIKHPRDESSELEAAHSHVGYSFDPNCKTKTKKESYEPKDNLYANNVDYDVNKPNRYPMFPPEPFKESYDKYAESSNFEFERVRPYGGNKYPKYVEAKPSKYNYPSMPDIPPSEKYYPEDIPPPRPKKKNRPHKVPEYPSDDLDDYILVPKKKYRQRPEQNDYRSEPNDYRPELEEDYDRPYPSSYDEQDDRYHPIRGNTGNKEVIRKIVKKRRPVVNLLDIFDI